MKTRVILVILGALIVLALVGGQFTDQATAQVSVKPHPFQPVWYAGAPVGSIVNLNGVAIGGGGPKDIYTVPADKWFLVTDIHMDEPSATTWPHLQQTVGAVTTRKLWLQDAAISQVTGAGTRNPVRYQPRTPLVFSPGATLSFWTQISAFNVT